MIDQPVMQHLGNLLVDLIFNVDIRIVEMGQYCVHLLYQLDMFMMMRVRKRKCDDLLKSFFTVKMRLRIELEGVKNLQRLVFIKAIFREGFKPVDDFIRCL